MLLVVTVTFFTCPDLLPLQNQLYLCLQWKNHIAVLTHQSEQTVVRLLNFLRNRRPASLLKTQVIIVRVFFHFSLLGHSFAFQCTVKVFVLCKSNFLYANCPFHSLWSRERQLPAVLNFKTIDSFPVNNCCSLIWLRRAKQTHVMCNFLYFLMIGWV